VLDLKLWQLVSDKLWLSELYFFSMQVPLEAEELSRLVLLINFSTANAPLQKELKAGELCK
jgi:hypothetical protein